MNPSDSAPDLARLRGVVAPEILAAAAIASSKLREAGVPHALAGGLAVGAHGYPRTTDDVDFLVGDEAFIKHAGGLVTLKVPLIAVGNVRIDFLSVDESIRHAVDLPPMSEEVPIVPLSALICMKLNAARQKDIADVVELLKRGKVDLAEIDQFLDQRAPELVSKWSRVKAIAASEE